MDSFFTLTPENMTAAGTVVYAVGTLLLAIVTFRVGQSSVRKMAEIASDQIDATSNASKTQNDVMREAAEIQARATSVSNNRQMWINSLRDEVSGFLADMQFKMIVDHEMRISEEREKQQTRLANSMRLHINRVELLINPTEGESTDLLTMLKSGLLNGQLSLDDERSIVEQTQTILKTEWERVKSGE